MHRRHVPRAGLRTLALAVMAAIAYVDPGNFAVNVAAGAAHGYTLVWVVVGASLTASVVQYLAAKLGIATGLSLAENCRLRYGRGLRRALWVQAELVVIMTDLAELVGGAFALYLLFGIPMVWGAVMMAVFGFVLLSLRIRGHEGFRPVLLALFAMIVLLLVAELVVAGVDGPAFVRGLVPRPLEGSAALLAVGIIGATVMPHALHFHSAVSREDSHPADATKVAAAGRARRAIALAMSLAAVANVSLVLIAARLPTEAAGGLGEAYAALGDVLGQVAAVGFGLALLASGLSSTIVGIYTGSGRDAGLLGPAHLAVAAPLAGRDPTARDPAGRGGPDHGPGAQPGGAVVRVAGEPAAAGAAHLAPRGDGTAGERPGDHRGRRAGHRRDHRARRAAAGGPVRRLTGPGPSGGGFSRGGGR